MKRPHIHIPDDDIDIYKAAYLATKGHTQEEIGYLLGVGQATVHRRLREARERKLIGRSRPPWTGSEVAFETVEEMLSGPVDELSDRFAALSDRPERLLEVRISRMRTTPEKPSIAISPAIPRATYSTTCCAQTTRSVAPGAGCCSAWPRKSSGSTIARARNGGTSPSCRSAATPPKSSGRRCSVPQTSRPISIAHSPAAPIPNTPSVASPAAFRASSEVRAPRRSESSSRRFRAIARSSGSIRSSRPRSRRRRAEGARPARVDEGGMIAQLDGVLTSLGTNEVDNRWLVAAATAARVEPSKLASACPGNVGGIFLSHPHSTAAQKKIVDRVNARWTGVSLEHLELCAKRATRDPKRLGVTVMACRGEKQALIAIECVRLGLVSRLILDRNTSHAIARALDRLEAGEAREN